MILYTAVFIVVVVFLVLKYVYSYWDRHGLPNIKPEIPYGNLRILAEKKESFNVAINNLYARSTDRLVGVYLFFRPAILIRDAHLAKRIMVNDFQHFHDRGVYCNEHSDPMSANLFALPGQRWKSLRAKLTPTFTSGQLRNMLPTFLDVGKKLQQFLENFANGNQTVNMRDIVSRYALDVVASVFFGFEANCLQDPEDPFRVALLDLNNPESFLNNIRMTGVFLCPGLLKFTGISSLSPPMKKFTTEVISSHLHQRETGQVTRRDFIQMLTDLRRKAGSNAEESLSDAQCAANVFLFYAAGADTSTGAITFTLHELTHNRDAMEKLQREIDEMMERSNGEITYDNINEMKYLDLCIKETLRIYPALAVLNRECTIDYPVPDSDVVIRKGTQVIIPLLGISMNEKYFPNPELYSPERFDEATKNYDPDAYYPFGVGPRNCIAHEFTHTAPVFIWSRYKRLPASYAYDQCVLWPWLRSVRLGHSVVVNRNSDAMFVYTLALLPVALFLLLRYIYSHWERYGVPHLKPDIPYGNLRTVVEKKESFGIAINNLYHRSTDRLLGVYLFFRPAILIRDPHLAKRIMVNDFQSFHDRGVYCNEKGDPFSANLFALSGERWKNMRAKLTPTFTSGQLRNMLPTLMDVGSKLLERMNTVADEKAVVDMRDIASRFVLDTIASVFFGFEANCIHNSEDPFLKTLLQVNQSRGLVDNIRTSGVFICPGLLKLTRLTSLPPVLINFVMDIITHQIEHREKQKISRKDFIQLLIDLRRDAAGNGEKALSVEQCAANVFLFYIAGSETSTAAISFTLHELSHQPEAMAKLQQEIDEAMERNNGEITYDSINEMKYLDMCVKETLRKYPGLPILNRECTIDYPVPDSDIVIRKGTQVIIPLLSISMNEKYFPNPELYSPERFDEATKNYDPDAYYPFGVGPRNCIGLRQGVLVSKIGLVLLLSKYNFRSTIPAKVKFAAITVGLTPESGFPMRIEHRK
uniref:Cytochrome P450 n=1 Tax=Anopheles minimus TaxID=112268 RepID=A0A182W6U9_9DIPT